MRKHVLAAVAATSVIAMSSSFLSASQILTPAGAGYVDGYGMAANAFDNQPTWDGSRPVSLETSYSEPTMAGWMTATVYYIDLGENWADWRIEQVWTKYMKDRGGDPFPFIETWWDDDNDLINDTGKNVTNQINFQTQPHTGSGVDSWGEWICDFDMSSNPMTPEGQYLMLRVGTKSDHATEYAFVGVVPEPTALGAMLAGTAGLLMGRRRSRDAA